MRCFKQTILGIFLCVFLSTTGICQNQSTTISESEYAVIPFYRAGNLIYIEARADDQVGFFLIDTGYSGILLNSQYFKGSKTEKVIVGCNGETSNVEMKYVNLSLGSIDLQRVYTDVADLSNLEHKKDLRFLGMIGRTFFRNYECIFDYSNQELTFFKLGKKGKKLALDLLHESPSDTIKFRLKGHLPVIKVQIGSTLLKLGLDTGSETNLINEKCLPKIQSQLINRGTVRLRGLRKEVKVVPVGVLTNIVIGKIPFYPMRSMFSDIEYINDEFPGPNIDGIIGYEFFSQYKTAINFKKRELYIWGQKNQKIGPTIVLAENSGK